MSLKFKLWTASNRFLLFLQYISGHFDTKIGSKVDSSSYTAILKELNTTPENVLFLTDVLKGKVLVDFENGKSLTGKQNRSSLKLVN